jgi:hypothetical protein
VLGSAIAVAILSVEAQGGIIQNPGFETGDFSGWTIDGDISDFGITTNKQLRKAGKYGAFFGVGDPDEVTYISQSFQTHRGEHYYLVAHISYLGTGPNEIGFYWNYDWWFGWVNTGPFEMTLFQEIVTAYDGASNFGISFRSEGGVFGLDAVKVLRERALPEPSGIALAGIGILGMCVRGAASRRARTGRTRSRLNNTIDVGSRDAVATIWDSSLFEDIR